MSQIEESEEAKRLAEEVEFGGRRLQSWQAYSIPIVAAAWSLFQLALPQVLLLSAVYARAIHLAFALLLVYLSFPFFKSRGIFVKKGWVKKNALLRYLSRTDRISVFDLVLGILATAAALYLVLDYEGIGQRQGAPHGFDLLVGVVLIILLLEAARRALGLALPLIAGTFILYSLVSEWMPDLIAFRSSSLEKLIGKLSMSTEGIYGVPLDVSASVVFLFVLFGAMLERAGGGYYFIQLAYSLLGRFRGGPAKAAVLASGLTGMVSGSSIANTVTTGTFTIPLMKKAGYPAVKAGAIEVAASTNGQLMPPIMGAAAFIIAEYTGLSYFEVVRAAIVPALIAYIGLIYITHIEALKLDIQPVPKDEVPEFWKTFFSGIHFLIPLLLLLYFLMIERRSAQLSAYYAILSLIGLMLLKNVVLALRKKVAWKDSLKNFGVEIFESLASGGRNMMGIGVAVAAAGIIVGVVTLGLGGAISEVVAVLSGGRLIPLLLITAAASLILGMGLPTTANYIVMATLTAPIIVQLGGDAGLVVPLIAAHLFVFYFGILSDDTPPVGLSAYAASAISKADPIRTGIQGFRYDMRTAILPFMFIFNTDLLLIGVTHWWEIFMIFGSGLAAIFAFVSLTQNYIYQRNRIWEAIGLLLTVAVLLRPDFFEAQFGLERWWWKLIGITLFFFIHLSQKAWPNLRRHAQ
ncbi:MAG: TRAP transporter permease [Bradymonadales bacterium]|nr:MAG: TRAP transporter permease [Bradymonadales bacterium]